MGFQHRNGAEVDGPGAAEKYSQEIRPHLLSDIDRLNQARADLDRLTDQLEILADWKDDFRKRCYSLFSVREVWSRHPIFLSGLRVV
jgi:hypothetical protein